MRLIVREATAGDGPAVSMLCRGMDATDYVPHAWDTWIHETGGFDRVAELDGNIVGYVHGGRVSTTEVFFQGLRVDPAVRRRGIALRLMEDLDAAAGEAGVRALRCTTGCDNRRARSLFSRIGMRETGSIFRRRRRGVFRPAGVGPSSSDAALAGLRRHGLLASRVGLAHYGRIYFAPTDAWIRRALDERRVIVAGDGIAVLDPDAPARDAWISTLAGPPTALVHLLGEVVPGEGRLIVDSPSDPQAQTALDAAGFDPANTGDRYTIVEGPAGGLRFSAAPR